MEKVLRAPKSNRPKDVIAWLKSIRTGVGHCELRKTNKRQENCDNHSTLTHHIDGNHSNNVRENILVLCTYCHNSIHHKGKVMSSEAKQKISINNARYWRYNQFSKEHRRKLSENAKKRTGKKNGMYGRKHSKESRRKISFTKCLNNAVKKIEEEKKEWKKF